MGKIKLSNEQELSIIADGIQAAGDSLTISLTADKTIAEYDEIFSEAMNTRKSRSWILPVDLYDPILVTLSCRA